MARIRMKTWLMMLSLTAPVLLFAQSASLVGHWEGAITRLGSVQLLRFDFYADGDSLTIQYDDPAQGYFNCYPESFKKIASKDTAFSLNFGYGNFQCLLNREYAEITGRNKNWQPEVLLHLKKTGTKEADAFSTEDLFFHSQGARLAGSIYIPASAKSFPLVLIVPGSGTQTRQAPYIRSLVHELSRQGIGVFAYDKRGCGLSEGNPGTASFYDLAQDALAALQYLRTRKDLKISTTGLYGVSQGGWIAPIVANRDRSIGFAILNVGPAVSSFVQELNRVEYSLRGDGLSQSLIDSALEHTRLYFKTVQSNKGWEELNASVQYFKKRPWAEGILQLPEQMNDADMLWWRKNNYDPAAELSSLKCRVLSVMGENDNLVPPETNKALMEQYLKKAGVPYKIWVLPGAGHNGIAFQTLLGGEWKWPEHYWIWPRRSPNYYTELASFIKNSSHK